MINQNGISFAICFSKRNSIRTGLKNCEGRKTMNIGAIGGDAYLLSNVFGTQGPKDRSGLDNLTVGPKNFNYYQVNMKILFAPF